MSTDAAQSLVSPRVGAERLGIATTVLYRAHRRGTIKAVKGYDKILFEPNEFERWVANRERLRRQGRPRGGTP